VKGENEKGEIEMAVKRCQRCGQQIASWRGDFGPVCATRVGMPLRGGGDGCPAGGGANASSAAGERAANRLFTLQAALENGVTRNQIATGITQGLLARSLASRFARENDPVYLNGTLVTWDNPADAFRHFVWNYNMAQNMGAGVAHKISTAHEIEFLRQHKLIYHTADVNSNQRYAFMPLEVLMDLRNNLHGAMAGARADRFPNATAAFDAYRASGFLITSLDQVAAAYGFDPSRQTIRNFDGRDWHGFDVELTWHNGIISNIKLR